MPACLLYPIVKDAILDKAFRVIENMKSRRLCRFYYGLVDIDSDRWAHFTRCVSQTTQSTPMMNEQTNFDCCRKRMGGSERELFKSRCDVFCRSSLAIYEKP